MQHQNSTRFAAMLQDNYIFVARFSAPKDEKDYENEIFSILTSARA